MYEAETMNKPSSKSQAYKELEIKFAVEEDLSNVGHLNRTVRSKSPNVQASPIKDNKNVLYSVKLNPREYEELVDKKGRLNKGLK